MISTFSTLTRVIIGVVAGGIVIGGAAVGYKYITRDTIKTETIEQLNRKEKIEGDETIAFKEAFKAKVKACSKSAVSLDVLSSFDEKIDEVEIEGDEVADDIKVGEEILLFDDES